MQVATGTPVLLYSAIAGTMVLLYSAIAGTTVLLYSAIAGTMVLLYSAIASTTVLLYSAIASPSVLLYYEFFHLWKTCSSTRFSASLVIHSYFALRVRVSCHGNFGFSSEFNDSSSSHRA